MRAQVAQPPQHENLRSMLCRLISMDKKPMNILPVPPTATSVGSTMKNGGSGKLSRLSWKLFQETSKPKKKALMEVKNGSNMRTLAMVLRNERELLTQSKEQEDEIATLCLQLKQKDIEVEHFKDLGPRQQWEEIRTLKDVVLFLETQPDRHLQDEISMLMGQIQCLAEELV
ncbi:hypothetical protein E2562_009548 [Oryza meyeriana var. granulata]|uniref:Uncharacterized protein n=1 Tax=Oryza meyeriana var. granulata TaxID=110450 RepID=A0A6G1F635_9ORYZ|nr:hypothetical protein E2562_009548 [Oryza meyeriana var. granulata]